LLPCNITESTKFIETLTLLGTKLSIVFCHLI
jgi:hypothetical protein